MEARNSNSSGLPELEKTLSVIVASLERRLGEGIFSIIFLSSYFCCIKNEKDRTQIVLIEKLPNPIPQANPNKQRDGCLWDNLMDNSDIFIVLYSKIKEKGEKNAI